MREAMPFLQQRDYGDAIELMTQRVAQHFAANFNFSLDSAGPAPRQPSSRTIAGPRIPSRSSCSSSSCCSCSCCRAGAGADASGWRSRAADGVVAAGGGGGGFGSGGGGGFGGFGGGGGFSGGGSSGSW